MKKLTMLIITILFICSASFATPDGRSPSSTYPFSHRLLGHVDYATYFTSRILEEVLPFDFDNPEAYVDTYYSNDVKGIRVGVYTLVSNNSNFRLTISHDKLNRIVSDTPNNPNMITSVDYILYIVIGNSIDSWTSCKSGAENAVVALSGSSMGMENGDNVILEDKSLYVFIEDTSIYSTTADTVANIQPGIYESYIYFELTGE